MFDLSNLPISGGVLLTMGLWAGASYLVGEEIAQRTIQNSGWGAQCASAIQASLSATRSEPAQTSAISCREIGGLVDALIGTGAGREMCDSGLGDVIDQSMALTRTFDPSARAQVAAQELAAQRLEQATANAPSRCACAAEGVAQDLSWALYAGSLRQLGGPRDLTADLNRALQSSSCSIQSEK